jgi:hypothetical protein
MNMNLLRLSDQAWPRSRSDLQRQFPLSAFPEDLAILSPDDLAAFDHTIPTPTPAPTPGPAQRVEEVHPVLVAGQWRQAWQLVAIAPALPGPDWLGFAGWLYVFPPIAVAMATARASTSAQGEPATTGLATALQDARLNQNYPVWQATWGQFLLASNMAPEPLGQIVARAIECNLPAEFIATLAP